MRRPYVFTRTSSSHARYNPIHDETEAKKAEEKQRSRRSFPFFTSNQPKGNGTVKPQPRQSQQPSSPPRTSGTFLATHHNTYTPTSSTDNIYEVSEKTKEHTTGRQRKRFSIPTFSSFRADNNGGDQLEINDQSDHSNHSSNLPYNDGASGSNPFLHQEDHSKKEKKKKSRRFSYLNREKLTHSWQERESAKRQQAKEQKEKAKEQERARKRNSGLGWAKSWSFGGERFGGTILADASGVTMPIFRCKGPCGLSCGF
ncbi:7fd9ac81-9e14-455b-9ac2-ee8222ae9c82-CDS [Sclerotinia trifoliorum]|uniref:7fd9ac81-9e14-455b-9ac2-ee8222ae9c82-CDS n=1 Tax=Sclerotinia trifoliorum TaxID=28548 RepID=A0A8H2VN49_9HELO|nr:7fd9ac81-9e14-455b-9ac2-ee8222ae9c82-CDS [Sclerotinia trifoliorum]